MVTPIFAFKYSDKGKPYTGIVVSTNEQYLDINLSNFNDKIKQKSANGIFLYKNSSCNDIELPLVAPSSEVLNSVLKLKSKTVRSNDLFKSYLKSLFPSRHLNPIFLCDDSIVLDSPFVEVNGNILCKWFPVFESKVSLNLIQQEQNCMVYHYEKPIFIYTFDYKRHTPAVNEEYFSLNCNTGQCIHFWKNATLNSYIEYSEHLEGSTWVRDYMNTTPITGFKVRS